MTYISFDFWIISRNQEDVVIGSIQFIHQISDQGDLSDLNMKNLFDP